jgi:hypothetical protein
MMIQHESALIDMCVQSGAWLTFTLGFGEWGYGGDVIFFCKNERKVSYKVLVAVLQCVLVQNHVCGGEKHIMIFAMRTWLD